MALSRRPARFQSRHSMQSRSQIITQEKLDLLRAAAARVYISNDQKPSDCSMETNKPAAAVEVKFENAEEADPDHGVKLLAAAAVEMAKAKAQEKEPTNV